VDCQHDWVVNQRGKALCQRCGYQARGKGYVHWWKVYGNADWRSRPTCLNCREPVMSFGTRCVRCRGMPTIEVPPPPSQGQQAVAWAKVDRMAAERVADEQKS
jgi:hypothetical protein